MLRVASYYRVWNRTLQQLRVESVAVAAGAGQILHRSASVM